MTKIADASTYPGALDVFTVSCAALLGAGETLATVAAGVRVWDYSPVPDTGAAALLRGVPSIAGTSVAAWVGGIPSGSNFLPGAVYSLVFKPTTSLGRVLVVPVNISVASFVPPSMTTGAALPASEFSVSSNWTPATPGTYFVAAHGLTMTIPAGSIGGDIVLVDMTTAVDPALNLSGSLLNTTVLTDALPRGGTATLHWSARFSGWVIL